MEDSASETYMLSRASHSFNYSSGTSEQPLPKANYFTLLSPGGNFRLAYRGLS
jgi:hypothetical protein